MHENVIATFQLLLLLMQYISHLKPSDLKTVSRTLQTHSRDNKYTLTNPVYIYFFVVVCLPRIVHLTNPVFSCVMQVEDLSSFDSQTAFFANGTNLTEKTWSLPYSTDLELGYNWYAPFRLVQMPFSTRIFDHRFNGNHSY